MKWLALTAIVLTCIFGLPFRDYDTAKLLPIRCIQARRENGQILLLSEAGEGSGKTWQEAVENLRHNASGEVFFDTAEQAVFSDEALAREAARSEILRPAAEVYFAEAFAAPEELHQYLSAHPSKQKISDFTTKEANS